MLSARICGEVRAGWIIFTTPAGRSRRVRGSPRLARASDSARWRASPAQGESRLVSSAAALTRARLPVAAQTVGSAGGSDEAWSGGAPPRATARRARRVARLHVVAAVRDDETVAVRRAALRILDRLDVDDLHAVGVGPGLAGGLPAVHELDAALVEHTCSLIDQTLIDQTGRQGDRGAPRWQRKKKGRRIKCQQEANPWVVRFLSFFSKRLYARSAARSA